MAVFQYRARNAQGEPVQGRLDGASAVEVAAHLLASELTPIDIVALREQPELSLAALLDWRERSIDLTQLQVFSRQLHTLLKAGVPILRALSSLRASSTNPRLVRILSQLQDGLAQGRELSTCMAQHPRVFDPFYLAMVRMGEMTGRLDETLDRLAQHLQAVRQMRNRIKQALRYPGFVILAMIAAVVVINLLVIPAFSKVYTGMQAELPWMTRWLLTMSNFTKAHFHWMLVGSGALILGWSLWLKTRQGRYLWDRYKLKLPIAGKILHKAALGHFARSLALAARSGVPILQALSAVGAVTDNRYLAEKIDNMRTGVAHGESLLRTATLTGVFTPMVLQMIAVGEETGELDRLLDEIADMYGQEVDHEIATLSQQIEPILITALGIMVLILALGIFLPVWDMGAKALGH
ncbi:MAG: type II secretion system F family protein [Thiobacillaceae bacterium]|nr:type II secretion system F family protein [Thiobacillaceae bacterium]